MISGRRGEDGRFPLPLLPQNVKNCYNKRKFSFDSPGDDNMEEIKTGSAERVLERILECAAEEKASDIHMEPQSSMVRVRFREDGSLRDRFCLPLKMLAGLSVRSKVMGHMNVGESRLPQDGSCSASFHGVPYDLRISILPSLYGETIVIRLLSGQVDFIEKNELGMLPLQEKVFRKCLSRRSGMILTAGPTGSGKTSTLYAALKILNRESVSIISVEDPVEYRVQGVTQVQVNEKAGLTFERGLRSIVRQDPDIVMIGEIRDRETAEIAVHAALTGHLVLSTLHTNQASDAPLRLMDMGIAPYLISASLSLIIAQRLAGRLCPRCREKSPLSEKEQKDLALPEKFCGLPLYRKKGCPSCHEGIRGRIGVFEMISIGRRERDILHHGFSDRRFRECMKEQGQPSMGEAALALMEEGIIPPEEASMILAGEE